MLVAKPQRMLKHGVATSRCGPEHECQVVPLTIKPAWFLSYLSLNVTLMILAGHLRACIFVYSSSYISTFSPSSSASFCQETRNLVSPEQLHLWGNICRTKDSTCCLFGFCLTDETKQNEAKSVSIFALFTFSNSSKQSVWKWLLLDLSCHQTERNRSLNVGVVVEG